MKSKYLLLSLALQRTDKNHLRSNSVIRLQNYVIGALISIWLVYMHAIIIVSSNLTSGDIIGVDIVLSDIGIRHNYHKVVIAFFFDDFLH